MPAARIGSRSPRYRHVPASTSSAGEEAVDLAAAAGLVLDPWQADVLQSSLAERSDGKWAAPEVALVVPRQNGKGAVLEARELHALFLGPERLIMHSAQDFKTCRDAFRRVAALIRNTPDLARRVTRGGIRTAHGSEGIELTDGTQLRFVARSRSSGRGFSGDLIVLDEAYALGGDAMAALMPTLSARPNPQIWYVSSAPLSTSEMLRRVCGRGRGGDDPGLAYFEWSAADDVPSDDRDAWVAANPALGGRLSVEFTARELAALPEVDFRRERLGVWEEIGALSVIPAARWDAVADPGSQAVGPLTFAFDVTPARTAAAVGVAAARADGLTHIEVVDSRPETWWLLERVLGLLDRWGAPVVVDPKGSAGTFIEPLRDAGVDVIEVGSRDVAAAAGRFVDACSPQAASLRHRGQPCLDAAVAGAATRRLGDAWAWDRRRPTVDISPLVAVTLALWGHGQATRPTPSTASAYEERGLLTL